MSFSEKSIKHFLIDEHGQRWSVHGLQVKQHLGSAIGGTMLAAFAVMNLGWIEIRAHQRRIGVRCRPTIISETAFCELIYLVLDHQEGSIALSVFGHEWNHYVYRDRNALITMLGALRTAPVSREPKLFSCRQSREDSPFADRVVETMAMCRERSHVEAVEHDLNVIFPNGRWTLSHIDLASRHLVIDRKGSGFTPFNPNWAAMRNGAPLHHYAGDEYAEWVTQTRRRVGETQEIAYDEVDATVWFPGLGYSRLRYTRVTIPIELAGGRPFVVSAAVTNTSINLLKSA
jgi:hypothetical protein